MKKIVIASVALAALFSAASPASAEITADAARAILVPFYKALNAEFAKDAPELIRQSTAPETARACPSGATSASVRKQYRRVAPAPLLYSRRS